MWYLTLQRNTRRWRRKLWCQSSRCWLTSVTMPTLSTCWGHARTQVQLVTAAHTTMDVRWDDTSSANLMISDHLAPFCYLFSPHRTHIPDLPVLLLWRSAELPEDKQRALPQVCDRCFQQGPFQQPLPQPAAQEKNSVGARGNKGLGEQYQEQLSNKQWCRKFSDTWLKGDILCKVHFFMAFKH